MMNEDEYETIQTDERSTFRKGRVTPPPKIEEPQISVGEGLRSILSDSDTYDECSKWANRTGYLLTFTYSQKISEEMATRIKQRWEKECATKAYWSSRILTPIPSLEREDTITVGELYAYLTKLIAEYPDIGSMEVYHEECCGNVSTVDVSVDTEKGLLILS